MTERTLQESLELAAKVEGIPLHIWGTKGEESVARMDAPNGAPWRPDADNSDSRRLEIACKVWVYHRMTLPGPGFLPPTVKEAYDKYTDALWSASLTAEQYNEAVLNLAAEIGATL